MLGVDIEKHNQMVERLWDDFEKRLNERIPILFACDEQFQLPLYGVTFREYYSDPVLMGIVQLETTKWWMNNVVQDARMGRPKEYWSIRPQLWMAEKEYFGCEIVYQENDYAWAKPIAAPKEDLLEKIWSIDPEKRIKENTGYKFYVKMKKRFEGRKFDGLPTRVESPPNIAGTHGIFTTAVEVRGQYQLLVDMKRDPEFVKDLLEAITEKIIERIKTWHALTSDEIEFPSPRGWMMCDDSVCVLSPRLYEEFVLPFHQKIYSEMTNGVRGIHLCGHAEQLFEILYEKVGVRVFDGVGPWVDVGWMRDRFGTDVRINAQVHHYKLKDGGPREIEDMVKNILTERAKRGGYMTLLGYAVKGVPISSLETMYKAGLKYGEAPR